MTPDEARAAHEEVLAAALHLTVPALRTLAARIEAEREYQADLRLRERVVNRPVEAAVVGGPSEESRRRLAQFRDRLAVESKPTLSPESSRAVRAS